MRSREADPRAGTLDDEAALRTIIPSLVEAWNRGSGEAFAAPFSEDADFIAFEGTHLQGREQIRAFHQRMFDTVLHGARLWSEAKFVHVHSPSFAILHGVTGMTLAGQSRPSPGRDSMQLFVATKTNGSWRIVALLNGRQMTLEEQPLWDAYRGLPPAARPRALELILSLSPSRTH